MPPTTDELIAEERRSMGRDCTIVSSAVLYDGHGNEVLVIVYEAEPLRNLPSMESRVQRQTRWAAAGDGFRSSGTVATWIVDALPDETDLTSG